MVDRIGALWTSVWPPLLVLLVATVAASLVGIRDDVSEMKITLAQDAVERDELRRLVHGLDVLFEALRSDIQRIDKAQLELQVRQGILRDEVNGMCEVRAGK